MQAIGEMVEEVAVSLTRAVQCPSKEEVRLTPTTPSTPANPCHSDAEKPTWYRWSGDDGERLATAVAEIRKRPGIGILFAGKPGNGKTTAARQYAGPRAWFWDCGDNSRDYQAFIRGEDRFVFACGRRVLIVDDLGAESGWNDFGTKREPMGEWLNGLYNLWANGRWNGRLFVTTNLTGTEIAERYGKRILSRLLEMCIPVRFEGHSFRRIAGRSIGA